MRIILVQPPLVTGRRRGVYARGETMSLGLDGFSSVRSRWLSGKIIDAEIF